MKYIKYLIIFFLIITIILAVLLLNVLNDSGNTIKNNNVTNNNVVQNQVGSNIVNDSEEYWEPIENNEYPNVELQFDNKLSYVKSRSDYFTISSLYETYIKEIIGKNIKTYIREMLSTQVDETTYIYIVKGSYRVEENNDIFDMNTMFEVNISNRTYNIYPDEYIKNKGIDKLKDGEVLNYNKEDITDKENKTFEYIIKTDAEVATEYFNNYSELLKYYPDEAYAKLNTEYAQKRFGSKENFINYLKENSEVLMNMEINMFKVYSTQNFTDYICADKYDKLYIFRQQGGIMRYSAYLDNYTVMTDSYEKEYNKLDKFDRSKYNLTKFINMVNTKDYSAIYKVLDNTFRSNNFTTQTALEKYITDNMYVLNKIEIEDFDNESYEYYVFEIKLINMKDESQSKNMTVIINQGEGTDFTMSFSFN